MARYYGSVQGSRGDATRTGSNEINAWAFGDEGIGVRIWNDKKNARDVFEIRTKENYNSWGDHLVWSGSYEELIEKLSS